MSIRRDSFDEDFDELNQKEAVTDERAEADKLSLSLALLRR